MSDDEYAVRLTFSEWMDVCEALGYREAGYLQKGMEGQANKLQAIEDKISEGLK